MTTDNTDNYSSNAVQLIQAILLLKSRQLEILRLSLLGNILTNLLLLTGASFLLGGLRYLEQRFNRELTQTITMLLFLAVLAMVVPTASHFLSNTEARKIASQSRGTAVIIMISYFLWLLFEHKTHRELFENVVHKPNENRRWNKKKPSEGDVTRGLAVIGGATAQLPFAAPPSTIVLSEDKELHEPSLALSVAVITIVISTALIALSTQYATDSLQGLSEKHVSSSFIGLIILPIISLDIAAITHATNGNMDISISLTLERCMQSALMIVPLTVLLAWCMGIDDMTLEFDTFSTLALFIAMIILGYVVQEGRSNW